ncbi:MAG: hypothetical protein WC707_01790 [Candidatus Babeliaceae bacterium]|jgi:hypothetical protein
MKYTVILILLSTLSQQLFSNDFTKQAHTWAASFDYQNMSPHDAQLIVSLLYWSHQRSLLTLQAQEAFIKDITLGWQLSENIIDTRLNPSRIMPNDVSDTDLLESRAHFCSIMHAYRTTNKNYTQCTDAIINGHILDNQAHLDAIKKIKNNARTAISQALGTQAQSLASWQLVKDHIKTVAQLLQQQSSTKKIAGGARMFSAFGNYFQSFFVSSFVAMDTHYRTVNKECWRAFLTSHEITNSMWQVIETTRRDFYHAHYTAFLHMLVQHELPSEIV